MDSRKIKTLINKILVITFAIISIVLSVPAASALAEEKSTSSELFYASSEGSKDLGEKLDPQKAFTDNSTVEKYDFYLSPTGEFKVDPYEFSYIIDESRLPAIRNQGNLGVGWAFASIASAESNILTYYGKDSAGIDLSESYLINYSKYIDKNWTNNAADYIEYGADLPIISLKDLDGDAKKEAISKNKIVKEVINGYGGNAEYAAHSMSNWIGMANEADYAYSKVLEQDFTDPPQLNENSYYLDELYVVPLYDREKVKYMIKEYGAAYINMYYEEACCRAGKYYYYNGESNKSFNHAVALIGWDDTVSTDNFNASNEKSKPGEPGAFIARNSAGDTLYISYADNAFQSADKTNQLYNAYFFVARKFPQMKYSKKDPKVENPALNLYSYDRGNSPSAIIPQKKGIAQIFQANNNRNSVAAPGGRIIDGVESVDGIMLYSYTDNVPYSLQVYRLNDKYTSRENVTNPLDGTPLLDVEKKGIIHAGYNKITTFECDKDNPAKIIEGEPVYAREGEILSYVLTFEKAVNIGAEASREVTSIDSTQKGKDYSVIYSDKPQKGESFIESNGTLKSCESLYSNLTPFAKIVTKDTDVIPFDNMALRIEKDVINLQRDKTEKIAYSFKYADPDAKITFESSDEDIATVDSDGKITTKQLGSCDIKVSYTTKDIDGNYYSRPKEYTVRVNVIKLITSISIKCFDKETGVELVKDASGRYVIGTKQKVSFKVYDQEDAVIPATALASFKSEYKSDFAVDENLDGWFTPYFQQVGWEETVRRGDVYLEKKEKVTAIVGTNITNTPTQIPPASFEFYARNDFDKVNGIEIKLYKVKEDGTRGALITPQATPDSKGNKVYHLNMSEKFMVVPVNNVDGKEINIDDLKTESTTEKIVTLKTLPDKGPIIGSFTDFARITVWEDESINKGEPCTTYVGDIRSIMEKAVAHSKEPLLTHIKLVPVNDVDRIKDGIIVINVGDDESGRIPCHSDTDVLDDYESDIVVGIDDGDELNDKRSIFEVYVKDKIIGDDGTVTYSKGMKIPEEYIKLSCAPSADYVINAETDDASNTKLVGLFPIAMQKKVWRTCAQGDVYDPEEIVVTATINKTFAHTKRDVEIPVKLKFKAMNDVKVVENIAIGCTGMSEMVPQWEPSGSTSKVSVLGIYDTTEHFFFAYDADDPLKTPITKGVTFVTVPQDGYKIASNRKGSYTPALQNTVAKKCAPGEVYDTPVKVIATLKADNAHTASDVRSDNYIFYPFNDINTYDIEFYNGVPVPYETQVVAEGNTVAVPIAPDIQGYTFLGWDLNPDDASRVTNPFDFTTKIVEGLDILQYSEEEDRYVLKLYAKWSTRSDYLISVDKCYGKIAIGDELVVNAKLSYETGEDVGSEYYIKMAVPDAYNQIVSVEIDDPDAQSAQLTGKIKGLQIGNAEVVVTAYKKSTATGVPDKVVASVRVAKIIVEVFTEQAIPMGDGYTVPVDGAQIKTVNDYSKKPDVKISSPEFNIFYKSPKAEVTIKSKTTFKLVSVELSDNLKLKYNAYVVGDKLTLQAKPGYEIRREDSGEKGRINFFYEGFTDPVVVQTVVKVKNVGPKITQKGAPTLSPVYTNTVKLNMLEGTEAFDFSDIVEKVDTTTFPGLRVEVKKTGIFVSVNRATKNVKIQKYSGKIRLNSNKWANGIDAKVTINVKKGNPKLTVSPSTITLNEMTPKMLAKTKVSLDRDNIRMLPFEKWNIELLDATTKTVIPNDPTDEKRWFDYTYKDGYLYVEYHYKDKFVYGDEVTESDPYVAPERRPYPGNYKLRISNVFESTNLSKEIALKIIEKDPVVTFKPSGSIDLINRTKSDLVETITLKNTEGKLKKVTLITEGHEYLNNFIVNVLSENSFMITMKQEAVARVNTNISLKQGIDFYVNIELQNEDSPKPDGTSTENVTVIEDVKFNYKPKQTTPRVKIEKVEIKKNERILLDLQSFMPDGVVIMNTTLAKELEGLSVTTGNNDLSSLKRAGVLISMDDSVEPGAKFSVRLDCTLLGAEEVGFDDEGNPVTRPITINIPVSVTE